MITFLCLKGGNAGYRYNRTGGWRAIHRNNYGNYVGHSISRADVRLPEDVKGLMETSDREDVRQHVVEWCPAHNQKGPHVENKNGYLCFLPTTPRVEQEKIYLQFNNAGNIAGI